MANPSIGPDGKSEHAAELGRRGVPFPIRPLNQDKDKVVQQDATSTLFSTRFASSFATQEPTESIVRKQLEGRKPNFFNNPPISGQPSGTSSNPPASGLEKDVQRLETAATKFEESAQHIIKYFNAVIEAQASFIEHQRTADEHVSKMRVVEAKLEGLLPTLLLLEDHCSRNSQSASEISLIKQQVKELLESQQHQTKTFQESHDRVKASYDKFIYEARRRLPLTSQQLLAEES